MTSLVQRAAWSVATLYPLRLVLIILLCLACLSAHAQTQIETRQQLLPYRNRGNCGMSYCLASKPYRAGREAVAGLRLLAQAYCGAGREHDARQAQHNSCAGEKVRRE